MAMRNAESNSPMRITRADLINLLNDDLAREYQAVISYVIYSQKLKGPQFMEIASELEKHAREELAHAITLASQIDYLGGMPASQPKPVQTSKESEAMLRFDLEAETDTIRHYRERVKQCESLGEFAIAEHIRRILVQEQDHLMALANALGIEAPDASKPQETISAPKRLPTMEPVIADGKGLQGAQKFTH